MSDSLNSSPGNERDRWRQIVLISGTILAISYPLLALSTGVRALYQLFSIGGLGPALSGVAALCYLTAAIGFAKRAAWAWRLSLLVLGFETAMTLLIGSLSFVYPELIGRTVWRHFGADYGYFPLFQPIIGLIWLVWPETRRAYGLLRQATQ
ncbi:MAG: hypothetical protein KJZ86_18535 [Caldilineaceae bacterium]|nr:hypothetical protein [Caldilineaceae bacterium]HRJ42616.1 hypothetical protein [Caldilineaceae bacterium]